MQTAPGYVVTDVVAAATGEGNSVEAHVGITQMCDRIRHMKTENVTSLPEDKGVRNFDSPNHALRGLVYGVVSWYAMLLWHVIWLNFKLNAETKGRQVWLLTTVELKPYCWGLSR